VTDCLGGVARPSSQGANANHQVFGLVVGQSFWCYVEALPGSQKRLNQGCFVPIEVHAAVFSKPSWAHFKIAITTPDGSCSRNRQDQTTATYSHDFKGHNAKRKDVS
jgi:FtsP/CotA-like multicopper oxidase with cupredoxin domain